MSVASAVEGGGRSDGRAADATGAGARVYAACATAEALDHTALTSTALVAVVLIGAFVWVFRAFIRVVAWVLTTVFTFVHEFLALALGLIETRVLLGYRWGRVPAVGVVAASVAAVAVLVRGVGAG